MVELKPIASLVTNTWGVTLPAPSTAEPSHRDVPTGTPPLAMEGVSGMDIDPSPCTTTFGDPSAVSPSVQSTPDSYATDGAGRTGNLGTAMIAPDCDLPATAAATCTGGVMTGYAVPITVGATSVISSPIHPVVGSSITAIAGCSATSKGIP